MEQTTQDRIEAAGWWPGSEREWQELPSEAKEQRAFKATGCAVAYPTWQGPVDCVHTGCLIRRGVLPKIAETNTVLRYEAESGWLRFYTGRDGRRRLALIFRAVRKAARETGIYDPWKLDWRVMVWGGIQA